MATGDAVSAGLSLVKRQASEGLTGVLRSTRLKVQNIHLYLSKYGYVLVERQEDHQYDNSDCPLFRKS